MPDYDAGFKIVARESGRELAAIADVQCDEWAPIAGEVHAAERLADRAFLARRGEEKFIVYMEAYTRWKADAPWSVLAKCGLLSQRERCPCMSLVYVLLPRSYRPQGGTFRLDVEGRPTQQIWFREICLWQLEPQAAWDDSPGLMALSPLFHQHQPMEQVVAHAARCIKGHTTDRIREADLLTVLGLFGKLSTPNFDPFHVIGREAMKESRFYQEIMEEGSANAHRADVLAVLKARFGKADAKAFKEDLDAIRDPNILVDLLDAAIRCRSVLGFRRSLERRAQVHSS